MTDNNGNLRKQEILLPGQPTRLQEFEYDSLNRLTSAVEKISNTTQWSQQFNYDRYGNRTITAAIGEGVNNKAFTINTANNRYGVPSGQSGVMQFDAAGNLTNDTYTGAGIRKYDAENKMTHALGQNGQAQLYVYDGSGQRVKRIVDGVETWQVYGLGGELVAEYAANGAAGSPQKEYGYRNAQLLITAEAPAAPPVNVASAANGATVTASSTYSGFAAFGAINGDRKGLFVWQNGFWSTAVAGFPAWLEVQFNGSRTITEIDVVTAQDNYNAPIEPSESTTFSQYGLTGYQVQYWTGSTWTTVPGGSVSGNNKVWRKFTFSPITTAKIRVLSSASPDSYSRLMEVEAWTGPSPAPRYNLALGATATASSSYAGWGASSLVNGDRKSLNAGNNGAWVDAAPANTFPDWAQIDFGVNKTITEIDVFTLQDNWSGSVEPTESMTFTQWGLTGYDVQYFDGSNWTPVTNGSVSGNNKIWRKFTFSPISTSKIRVVSNASLDGHSRLTEIEAYGPADTGGAGNGVQWLVADHLGTPRIIFDQSGEASKVKRNDYAPFGEALIAGGRASDPAYSGGDRLRQQFTQKERDIETGLDYFGARYYASTQGRFTSVDPMPIKKRHLIDPRDLNRYAYVANNPLKYIDPEGLEKIVVIVRTFIPYEKITHPPGVGPTFKGDYNSKKERISARTEHRMVVETDAKRPNSNNFENSPTVGRSERLARGLGSLMGPSQGSASGETMQAGLVRINDNTVRLDVKADEANPLVSGSPGITYRFNITVSSEGETGRTSVGVLGEHDGFPAYEIEVIRPDSGGTSTKVYQHDPNKTGDGPQSLYGSGEYYPEVKVVIEPKKKP